MLALNYFLIDTIHELFFVLHHLCFLLLRSYNQHFLARIMCILSKDFFKMIMGLYPIIQYFLNIFLFKIDDCV